MSIPFKKLRTVFIIDILISALSLVLLFILAVYISTFTGGYFSKSDAQKFGNIMPGIWFFYFILTVVMISWICLLSVDKKYVFIGLEHRPFWKKVFFLMTLWISFSSMLIFLVVLGLSLELVYHFLIASVCFGSVVFLMRAIFHRGISHAKIWHCMGYGLAGIIFLSSTYYMTFLFSKNDLVDSRLSTEQRVNTFKYYSLFYSEISMNTFKVIEPQIPFSYKSHLYSKVDFNPSGLGLNYFLDDSKDQLRLIAFLRYGKPDRVFLEDLFVNMKKREKFWNVLFVSDKIKYLAFRHWPRERMIPLEIVEFKKSADLFKDNLKRKRSPANLRR